MSSTSTTTTRCHLLAVSTLDCLDQVVGQFAPEQVQLMKNIDGTFYPNREVGKNAGKTIAYLRHEYLAWSRYRQTISRFDCTQQVPVTLCGIIAPSAHALLDQLVRRVLNRAWAKIIPWSPGELRTPEENLWPDSRLFAGADLDEIADAVLLRRNDVTDSLLDADCINWLEAALQQEHARLIAQQDKTQDETQPDHP